MKNKKNSSKLPLIITLSVIGAAVVGVGVFAIVKHFGNKSNKYFKNIEYPDVRAYFEERAEIVSVTPVKDSKNTLSEKSAVEELRSRGFTEYPVTADYTIDGGIDNPVDASDDSSAKHPIYRTYFVTSDNELWAIALVDGQITATPSSYNLSHTDMVPIEVSETDTIASYDASTNSIYLTIPFESTKNVCVVDRIDAETLESFEPER